MEPNELEYWLDSLPVVSDDDLADMARQYAADECATARTIEALGEN